MFFAACTREVVEVEGRFEKNSVVTSLNAHKILPVYLLDK